MGKQPPDPWQGFKRGERYNLIDQQAKVAYPIRDIKDLRGLELKLDIPGSKKKR